MATFLKIFPKTSTTNVPSGALNQKMQGTTFHIMQLASQQERGVRGRTENRTGYLASEQQPNDIIRAGARLERL